MKIIKPHKPWAFASGQCPSCKAILHLEDDDTPIPTARIASLDLFGHSYFSKTVPVWLAACPVCQYPDVEFSQADDNVGS